jgi:putative hydrolase of HD superfamily
MLDVSLKPRLHTCVRWPTAAAEVEALWHEYEAQSSPESHLVKDFDKLEMIIQAHEYEQAQGLQLQQFFDSTQGKFKTPTG